MEDRKFLTQTELAQRWNMARATLTNWRCLGRGPAYIKISSNILYPVAEVIRWEDQNIVDPASVRERKAACHV
ncbi:helix-turn-helix domain-containing protein [Haematospirillum sp. H1815]|uniref:helix-turn-helix transcriptional regulator n=1 Tax=Haematospirillum sp. H1815 TaxID=2723108 RepID=UPI00143BA613|nr:helix-turn-helix domain-containing protein [Haematospirillum sp. H1815]NKD76581.1 helix-turn-helix domain-containing protein [Haematospirillum sp. H1815]